MQQIHQHKRTYQEMRSGRGQPGRKYFRHSTAGRSANMVATRGFESSVEKGSDRTEKLNLPATRDKWLFLEQRIVAKAQEKEIFELLNGTYSEPRMYPSIEIVEFDLEMDNSKTPPEPRKDAFDLTIPRRDANGLPVILNRRRVQTKPGDFSLDRTIQLDLEYRKAKATMNTLKAKAWAFLMEITELHHRELIIRHQPTQDIHQAWNDIRAYFEGTSMNDKRLQLELLKKSIPKQFAHWERSPTCEEITALVGAITSVCSKFSLLVPPVNIPDHDKKILFIESLPSCCDDQIQMIQSLQPDLTFAELTERWRSSKQALEFKSETRGDAKDDPASNALYSRDHTYDPRGGRGGR